MPTKRVRARHAPRPHAARGAQHASRSEGTLLFELGLVRTGRALRSVLSRAPYMSAGAIGLGAFALASVAGVGELAAAVGAAYGAYRMLRLGENPRQATQDAASVGQGNTPRRGR